jgi:Fic family protein
MIHAFPQLQPQDQEVLGKIEELRKDLRHQVNLNPVRWTGFLRRNTFARALQGSNSIEGINADLAEAVAIVDEEKPDTLEEETEKALTCYRTAMTYVLRLHDDPHAEINAQLIRSLHFMMLSYDMTMLPGQAPKLQSAWQNAIPVLLEPRAARSRKTPSFDAISVA